MQVPDDQSFGLISGEKIPPVYVKEGAGQGGEGRVGRGQQAVYEKVIVGDLCSEPQYAVLQVRPDLFG